MPFDELKSIENASQMNFLHQSSEATEEPEVEQVSQKKEIHFNDLTEEDYDRAFEAADEFEDVMKSEEVFQEWRKQFFPDRLNFFSESNFTEMEPMHQSKRLAFLARSIKALAVKPSMVHEYFYHFPQDLEAIKDMYSMARGFPSTASEHELYGVSFLDLEKYFGDELESVSERYRLESYRQIANRRELAPYFLINGFEQKYGEVFEKFGPAAEGFNQALSEAGQLSFEGDHFIDDRQMFTEDYEQLPDNEKAELLRLFIAELQYSLLHEEVYNSVFSPEMVERHKMRDQRRGHYNVAHSMIYKTYQPVSAFNMDENYYQGVMTRTIDGGGLLEEYPFHRLLLSALNELKTIQADQEKNVDLAVEFWDKNRNPIFGGSIAGLLSEQGVNRAASQLLDLLRKEKVDKTPLASILYRLEFGRIGISEKGVKYLEKMYDLQELNNPNYFVNRLTVDGDVGIFDDNEVLIKYFKLGDLSDDQEVVKAKVLDFTYQVLFYEKDNESEQEMKERLEILQEFQVRYFDFYSSEIFQNTGVSFNSLSFKEQGWYLYFINHANDEEKDEALSLVQQFGELGLKTFLSLEQDREMGQKILKLFKALPKNVSQAVMDKYSQLLLEVDRLDEMVNYRTKKIDDFEQVDRDKIRDRILGKANRLLSDSYNQIVNKQSEPKEILRQLSSINAESTAFISLFRTLKENAEARGERIDLKELLGMHLNVVPVSQLQFDKDRVSEMEKIYRDNYSTEHYPKEFVDSLISDMLSFHPDAYGVMYDAYYFFEKDHQEIVSFAKFTENRDESNVLKSIHFGAFNTNQEFSHGLVGDELLQKALESELLNHVPIVAKCDPRTYISQKYIEMGFVAKELFNYKGVDSLSIELLDMNFVNNAEAIKKRELQKDEIMAMSEQSDVNSNSDQIATKIEKNKTPNFDLLKRGYVLTRFFTKGDYKYCLFQKEEQEV